MDLQPRIIMVTPSYMLAILDEFRAQGARSPARPRSAIGIFGAEPWTNAMRAEIEEAFDMDAVDMYGLSEVIGPGVANECVETKDGLHVWEDHFYPEIVDPATGSALPDGERGELVLTSLTKEGMPVIRYRTRDLTRLLPGTARTMRRIEKITGRCRRHDHPARRQCLPDADRGADPRGPSPRAAFRHRADARRPARRHDGEGRGGRATRPRARRRQQLAQHIKSLIGVSARVERVRPGTMPRSIGKAKRVIDLRPKG